ncbi:predicted protein [Botrytis cinerea T4]|uniref:Uncharacterized protein n=1 Tax=Botryotinia fuckeliana (strain T4) TaxID=999810 RepID=G2YSX8_BOTF4|nr:predicted protein [Botrytis cinerea T4]
MSIFEPLPLIEKLSLKAKTPSHKPNCDQYFSALPQ